MAFQRRFGGSENDKSLIRDRLVAEPWFIDRVSVSGSTVEIEGWSFANDLPSLFYINGKPFDEIEHPLSRPDVGEVFWQRRNASMSGFRCSSSNVDEAYPNGLLEISRASDDTRIDSGRDSWYLPDAAAHQDLPDPDRRFRVIGNREAGGFLDTGATDFHRLSDVAKKLSGKAIWEFDNVLDWGVGCGRLARYFPHGGAALTGCDIDQDNVAWCRANLEGRFVHSALEPPLPFSDQSFDLIYGVSVFTHLKEALQDKWLAELRRVTRVGGLVLTTVHGETAVEFFRLPPIAYRNLKSAMVSKGLLVSSANSQLQGHVDRPDEYVNVFHHRDYIASRWARHFEILHVIPGYIFTHDLVVMRRTS